MGLPECAKEVRVTTSTKYVIDNGLIAWTLYERHRQDRKADELIVKIGRRKKAGRRRANGLEFFAWSRYGTQVSVIHRAGPPCGSSLADVIMCVLTGFSRLIGTSLRATETRFVPRGRPLSASALMAQGLSRQEERGDLE